MKSVLAATLTLVLLPAIVQAQDPAATRSGPVSSNRLSGHVFMAPGIFRDEFTYDIGPYRGANTAHAIRHHTSYSFQLGGGVTWRVYKSVGVSGEIGVLGIDDYPLAAAAVNGIYHFGTTTRRTSASAFIKGGYSRVSTANGINAGTGIDYALGERFGLRMEVRGIRLNERRAYDFDPHPLIVEFRMGLTFRIGR